MTGKSSYGARFYFEDGAVDKAALATVIEPYAHLAKLMPNGKSLTLRKAFDAESYQLAEKLVSNLDFRFRSLMMLTFDEPKDWLDREEVVGAVLSPDSDFTRVRSSPSLMGVSSECGTAFAPEAVVDFQDCPTKRKIATFANGFDSYFSPGMIDLFDCGDAEFRECTLAGQPWNFQRLVDLPSIDFIDAHLSAPPNHAVHHLCGLEFSYRHDLWVSNGDEPLAVNLVASKSPIEHVGLDKQLLVSLPMARKIVAMRIEAELDPIYSGSSIIAAQQQRFLKIVRPEN